MKIHFVNHSSFVVESGAIRLVCDPWLEGTAFNDGWALLSPSRFGPEDWASITHLWFSHEHPDHFSPATLRTIPEASRARITVLYQETADRKVVDFCRKLGFGGVRELAPGGWIALGEGFEVWCEPWDAGDSWLAVRSGGKTLLNVNDCGIYTPLEASGLRDKVGPIDVLATQFSLSAWSGDPDEPETLRSNAAAMLDRLVLHARELAPRWTLPFASFVWFCHEENAYLNAYANRIEAAVAAIRERTDSAPLVLYPGDAWQIGAAHDPGPAIARYAADHDDVSGRPLVKGGSVAADELVALGRAWCGRVAAGTGRLRLRTSLARERMRLAAGTGALGRLAGIGALLTLSAPEAWIWLTDYGAAYSLSLVHGLRPSSRSRERCDVALSSDSLRYAFQFLWGGETLLVNARFRELHPDGRRPLFGYFGLAASRNRGERIDGWGELMRRKLRRAIKRG